MKKMISINKFKRKKEFPHYFKEIKDTTETKKLIERGISSILRRLRLPHLNEKNELVFDNFFDALYQNAHEKFKNEKFEIFIGGGVVRSLLAYIYKELHIQHLKSNFIPDEKIIKGWLCDIINSTNPLNGSSVLGVCSDLDIYLTASNSDNDVKYAIKKTIIDFINSAEKSLNLRDYQDEIKHSLVPIADVKDYNKQLERTTSQGGSHIDWLAFEVKSNKDKSHTEFKLPEVDADIINNFIQGEYSYTAPKNNEQASAKQVIRGLRPLVEMPSLRIKKDDGSRKQIITELLQLKDLDSYAIKQIQKLERNSNFGFGNNRVYRSENSSDDKIKPLVTFRKLLTDLNELSRCHMFIPEQSFNYNVELGDSLEEFMINKKDFIDKHTDNGKLYHGTSMLGVISIIRSGLWTSNSTQGTSACGPGCYTSKDISVSKVYAGEVGAVIPLSLKENFSPKVVDWSKLINENKSLATKIKNKALKLGYMHAFHYLREAYEIDIIINTHVIIQNAKGMKLPNTIGDLVSAIFCRHNLEKDGICKYSGAEIEQLFNLENLAAATGAKLNYSVITLCIDNLESLLLKSNDDGIISNAIASFMIEKHLPQKDLIDNLNLLVNEGNKTICNAIASLMKEKYLPQKDLIDNLDLLVNERRPSICNAIASLMKEKYLPQKDLIDNLDLLVNAKQPSIYNAIASLIIEKHLPQKDLIDNLDLLVKGGIETICNAIASIIRGEYFSKKDLIDNIKLLVNTDVKVIYEAIEERIEKYSTEYLEGMLSVCNIQDNIRSYSGVKINHLLRVERLVLDTGIKPSLSITTLCIDNLESLLLTNTSDNDWVILDSISSIIRGEYFSKKHLMDNMKLLVNLGSITIYKAIEYKVAIKKYSAKYLEGILSAWNIKEDLFNYPETKICHLLRIERLVADTEIQPNPSIMKLCENNLKTTHSNKNSVYKFQLVIIEMMKDKLFLQENTLFNMENLMGYGNKKIYDIIEEKIEKENLPKKYLKDIFDSYNMKSNICNYNAIMLNHALKVESLIKNSGVVLDFSLVELYLDNFDKLDKFTDLYPLSVLIKNKQHLSDFSNENFGALANVNIPSEYIIKNMDRLIGNICYDEFYLGKAIASRIEDKSFPINGVIDNMNMLISTNNIDIQKSIKSRQKEIDMQEDGKKIDSSSLRL